jgi:ribosomal subunit interface protein
MALRVSGKNLDIGDALRTQAKDKTSDAVSKYFDGGYSGHLTVEKEGNGFRIECTLHLDSGATMHVEATADDAYQTLNRVVERVAKQLRRYKRKRIDDLDGGEPILAINGMIEDMGEAEGEPEGVAAAAAIIAEPSSAVPRLSTAQAVARIETGESESVLYLNPGTLRFNLVRRRADGHIGWVDLVQNEAVARS